ncbi:hypothetical protein [Catellatospora sp. NPDC049609]|uniref:hypothetical protein n=1 Tax=Catellatospora sp. NPDC049609 TaxID=3155505 RepID=UPI00343290DF
MLFTKLMRLAGRADQDATRQLVTCQEEEPAAPADVDAITRFSAATAWAREDTRLLTMIIDGLRRPERR